MPFCMYLRKSRADAEAEARGEGETLARHEKALLEVSKRGHYNVTEIYREVSPARLSPPGLSCSGSSPRWNRARGKGCW